MIEPLAPRAALTCEAHSIDSLYPPDDPAWTAHELIMSIENVRRNLSVPFFLYEFPATDQHSGIHLDTELAKLRQCQHTWGRKYWQNSGEYHFLSQLSTHQGLS